MTRRRIIVAVLAILASSSSASRPDPIIFAEPDAEIIVPVVPEYRLPSEFAAIVAQAADEAGVPLWVAARLAEAESGFDPICTATNPDGSVDSGFWQLNSRWLDDFAWRFNDGMPVDPFDLETSSRVAMRYLASLHRATGTWPGAVAAYNCGLRRFQSGEELPARTIAHVARVFKGMGTI